MELSDLKTHPVEQFLEWYKDAEAVEEIEKDAMALATVGVDGAPHVRIVYYKGLVGNKFIFYTNYDSPKSRELTHDSRVALVFYWSKLYRQIRIEGVVEQAPSDVSDQYFQSRPFGSQMSALVSPQSQVIPNRDFLEAKIRILKEQGYNEVKRPANWGGFVITPRKMEFWIGQSQRLHDRFCYTNEGSEWMIHRLAP